MQAHITIHKGFLINICTHAYTHVYTFCQTIQACGCKHTPNNLETAHTHACSRTRTQSLVTCVVVNGSDVVGLQQCCCCYCFTPWQMGLCIRVRVCIFGTDTGTICVQLCYQQVHEWTCRMDIKAFFWVGTPAWTAPGGVFLCSGAGWQQSHRGKDKQRHLANMNNRRAEWSLHT